MKYQYLITAWKNDTAKKTIEVKTKSEANKTANKMIAGHYGFLPDAVDINEMDDELRLHSKTAFTLWNGKWDMDYQYIGEDE